MFFNYNTICIYILVFFCIIKSCLPVIRVISLCWRVTALYHDTSTDFVYSCLTHLQHAAEMWMESHPPRQISRSQSIQEVADSVRICLMLLVSPFNCSSWFYFFILCRIFFNIFFVQFKDIFCQNCITFRILILCFFLVLYS